MASRFIGLRLNFKQDRDILDAIENHKDMTKEVKRLLRLGIAVSNGKYVSEPVIQFGGGGQNSPDGPSPSKKLDWNQSFPSEPTVTTSYQVDKKKITANILGGFD